MGCGNVQDKLAETKLPASGNNDVHAIITDMTKDERDLTNFCALVIRPHTNEEMRYKKKHAPDGAFGESWTGRAVCSVQ